MSARAVVRAAFAVSLLLACFGWTPLLAVCDTTAPALTGFSLSTSAIDTTLASQTVTCNMTLVDALSGVSSATCTFTAPDFLHRQSCSLAAPTTGTPQNGTWSCAIAFPRYSPSGTWTGSVSASDAVGNSATINPLLQGFPSFLTVTSDPDLVAPALTTFGLVPGTVNVSSAAQNVACNMTLTDAKSGVAVAYCILAAPDSSQGAACIASTPTSGTRNSGVFSCNLPIPRYADAGTWMPQVYATDLVGNSPTIPFVPAATLTVTSVPEDITAPSLTSGFDFNPKSISVGAASKAVTCTIPVADSPAGVATASCSFTTSTVTPAQTQSCTATAPVTGTRNSGTFQCTVNFPRYAAGDTWTVTFSLDDQAGNSVDLPQATPVLTVDCNAGDVETTCRFAADKQSLTWDAVAGATQYDIYRDALTNLTLGYGTCQNSRDGSITDTTFLDTNVPTAAQKGFFYLVAYKIAGVEKGLGTNSLGTPRTVTATCP